jgi:hypothetical protein
MCFTIEKFRVRISARNTATSTKVIHGIPQSLQAALLKTSPRLFLFVLFAINYSLITYPKILFVTNSVAKYSPTRLLRHERGSVINECYSNPAVKCYD